jgi:hypothetical protein
MQGEIKTNFLQGTRNSIQNCKKSSLIEIKTLFVFLILLLSGCSYRFGTGGLINAYSSISIPYVEGDKNGELTNALIRRMVGKGGPAYLMCGGDLLLYVCLEQPRHEMIGFIFAKEDGVLTDIIVSNEARIELIAKVTLVERQTGRLILGPLAIPASLTYDFEPDLTDRDAHQFALGQLEINPQALEAAYRPLFTLLAEKIVDTVIHSW